MIRLQGPLGPSLIPLLLMSSVIVGCHHAEPLGSRPIPLADHPPWQVVVTEAGFRIAMDTGHLEQGPHNTWFVWFVTTHAQPQGPDSLRFDRGRIRLLVRCDSPAFKSSSEELALGDGKPVFHEEWPLTGPQALDWRVPASGTTDDQLLRAACSVLRHHGAA